MFFGTHTPRLDDKGRVVLPAKFRDELGEVLVITPGQDRCLFVFPMPTFEQISAEQDTREGPRGSRDNQRMLFAGASDEQPDKQGRITIPPRLREYARLERDCVVIGMRNRLEIWDAAAWQRFTDEHEDAFSDAEEGVIPGVI